MPSKPKVIIDTDPGIDDAAAIFMAIQAHKANLIELIAITTVNGNTSLENANINIFRILEITQMLDIPVYSGCLQGLVKKFSYPSHLPRFHGLDGFGDVFEEKPSSLLSLIQKEHASLALLRLVQENSGEIIMMCIGPLTNVAITMNLCPEWSSKLRDFYVMGGNVSGEGNVAVAAEFNFICDPEAAKVVIDRTQIPIKVTPWDTCLHKAYLSFEEREKLGSTNTPRAKLLNMLDKTTFSKLKDKKFVSCDQVAVAWLLDDYASSILGDDNSGGTLATEVKEYYATIEVSGDHTRGQLVLDHRCRFLTAERGHPHNRPNILCLQDTNKKVLVEYLKLAFV